MANILKEFWKYILIPIVASLFIFYLLQTPKYAGVALLPDKYNPITIKRDEYGVPSIESKTLKDTMYGLGYAQAQDRLWALNTRKLLISGRLSELVGEKTLGVDKFFRNLGLRRYCEYSLEIIDNDSKELFQAFADGVNDYVSSSKILPLEFWLTWSSFEPFTILDTVVNAKFTAFFLAFNFQYEFIQEALDDSLGFLKAADLLPQNGENFLWNDVVIMNDDELKQEGLFEKFNANKTFTRLQNFEFPEERRAPASNSSSKSHSNKESKTKGKMPKKNEGIKIVNNSENGKQVPIATAQAPIGSNAWVIHGNHTTTGKPILAHDPHLNNGIPSTWYPASIFYEGNYVAGAAMFGFPGIHIGKTKYITWGVPTLYSDTSDLYILQTEDNKYLYENEWHPLKEFKETIKIRGRDELVEITFYESHHGVVLDYYLPDVFATANFKPKENTRYALAWPGYNKVDNSLLGFFKMIQARNAQDIFNTWKDALIPSFSLLFATSEGDIGFLALGKIPIRKNVNNGLKPLDGSLKENDWLGYVPWESQPKLLNPKKGYIVGANNKMATENIKYFTSAHQASTSRAVRINELIKDLISQRKKLSVEDMIMIQTDTLDVLAREVTPILIHRTYDALKKNYKLQINNQKLDILLKNLTDWDYNMNKESVPASIFNVWERFLIQKLLKKTGLKQHEISSIIGCGRFDHFFFRHVLKWDSKIPSDEDFWCLNEENEAVSDPCLFNLAKSLEETFIYLETHFGPDMDEWQWGKVHSLDYPHASFSSTPLKPLFHRRAPGFGNGRTVNVARMKMDGDSFQTIWSANLRIVVSMLENDKSFYIIDTGVSENIFSEHYDDQMKLYHQNKYLEIGQKPRANWKDILYFKPQSTSTNPQ